MVVLRCEGGLPECSEYGSSGAVEKVQPLPVPECMVGTLHVLEGIRRGMGWQG